jgi:hypothetical protein
MKPLDAYESNRLNTLREKKYLTDDEIREFQRLASQALQFLEFRRSHKPLTKVSA